MTKSLTEQWKNGELGFGYYYIDFGIGGVPMLFNGLEFYCERTQKPNAIKTILAPVPSYNHFSQLVKKVEQLQEQLDELQTEKNNLLNDIVDLNLTIENREKKLAIATKALSNIEDGYSEATGAGQTAREALKEMEGVK